MDFIHPGFCYSQRSKPWDRYATDAQPLPVARSPQRIGRVSPSDTNSAPSVGADREKATQIHWRHMEDLKTRGTVHLSRSLDHYCHQRVSSKELQDRVEDQVLTRFMSRQTSDWVTPPTNIEAGCLKALFSMCLTLFNKLQQYSSRSHASLQTLFMEEGRPRGRGAEEAVEDTSERGKTRTTTDDTQLSLQILVVPQLWLWKFDSECEICDTHVIISRLFILT